jgi:hypothetical protein
VPRRLASVGNWTRRVVATGATDWQTRAARQVWWCRATTLRRSPWLVARRCGRRSSGIERCGSVRVNEPKRAHLKVEREFRADAARSRTAEDRQAKAQQKERIEAEHQAALATAAEQNTRLSARVNELADMLRSSVGHPRWR